MGKQISPELKYVKTYLTIKSSEETPFQIPEYQRAYSWGISQCDKLLQDIEDYMESGGTDPYFFGTIILDRSKNEEGIEQRNLIDGQQRTTSFFLLLKAILLNLGDAIKKSTGDDSQKLRFSLEERRKDILKIIYMIDDDEELMELLYDESGELIKQKKLPLFSTSINENHSSDFDVILHSSSFEDAEHNVYHAPRKQKDNKYTSFFRNFKFFYEKMAAKSPSQLSEFARSFLSKCQVIEISSWDVEQAIVMFNSLNSTGLPLSDADVLSAQLYSKAKGTDDFKKKWADFFDDADNLNNKNISSMLDIFSQYMYILRAQEKNKDVTMKGIRKFFVEENRLDKPFDFVDNLIKIADGWDAIHDNSLVRLLLKFNYNFKFFMATYFYAHGTDHITKIAECLLRLFTILELVDSGYSSKLFKQFLFEVNLKLADEKVTDDDIVSEFKKHIEASWKKSDVFEALKTYRGNLLVLLNEYLYCKNHNLVFEFDDSYNIEHIMPASGKNIPTIREDAGLDEETFKDVVDQLGNKIMLEEEINKSIGNEWFKTKKLKSVKDKTGYKDSKYKIAIALTTYSKDLWTKSDIETATEKVANRIVDFLFE